LGGVATPRDAFWAFGAYAGIVVAVACLARIPLRVLGRRLAIELPFVAFAVLLPVVGTGPYTEVLGLSLSVPGLWGAWSILVKGTLGVAATGILVATTDVRDLLQGLEKLHVPRTFTAIATFMIRYTEVIAGELRAMRIARISRGHDPRWIWQARAVAATAGTLFIRSYERGERVYLAMASRGYGAEVVTSRAHAPGRDWARALSVPAAAAVVASLAVVGTWT
jgi:cobalt/nickel transport system permease protein